MDHMRFDFPAPLLGHAGTRRGALGWLAGSLGALGLVDVQARQKRRRRKHGNKKKFRSVTRSFANDTAISIPGTATQGKADPYPLTIDVSGFKKGEIQDVNVTLRGITHTFPAEIGILLVAPDGKNAIIFRDVGGGVDATDVTITLDDQVATALSRGPLVSGTFRPSNLAGPDDFPDAPPPSGFVALSTFNGSNPNGTWQFFVVDDSTGATGTISDGFQLTITAKVTKKKRKKRRKH